MPREILTPEPGSEPAPEPEPADAWRPEAGFFGKITATGDFVARGLPDAFRHAWDRWITRHLAPRQRAGADWPAGGVRFRLSSGGRAAGGVILPGGDSAGRPFPLTLLVIGPAALPGPAALDPWCDAAAALPVAAMADADALWAALDALPLPQGELTGAPPLILWRAGRPAEAAAPDAPGAALDRLFTDSG